MSSNCNYVVKMDKNGSFLINFHIHAIKGINNYAKCTYLLHYQFS